MSGMQRGLHSLSDNEATRWVFTTGRVKCTPNILSGGEEIAREVKGR